ncbi:hypothetical protein [Paraburkholderia saeva]|uniref:hypothetical protein n=1 Tax=Paraburkholderia saeva TaxID=2777537 RepID=UPI001D5DD680|nr:hypothetical protein [Paraburkholderia saeva]CAG4887739.1 hypothetical protein R52603_00502 [Paraburkholderia saeva]
MYVEIDQAMAKITSVTPIMEKHGKKKKRPAHSIIFEFAMSNTVLDSMDSNGLRDAFYRKPQSASVDKKGQTNIDTSSVTDGISQLRFPWWQQWIDIPGDLTGWVLTLHTGNTDRSHIVLEEAKISSFQVLPKDLAITLLKCKAIVHPTAHEKGKIDELLQTDVPVSIMPPDSMEQGDMIGHGQQPDTDDEADDADDAEEEQTGDGEPAQEAAPASDAPREDPFAGTDLARGVVKSDAKVMTKKARTAAPADKHADGAWPFPSPGAAQH